MCNYVVNWVSLEALQKKKAIMNSSVECFALHVINPRKELFSGNHYLPYPGDFSSKAPRFDLDRQSTFLLCFSIIPHTFYVSNPRFFHNSITLVTQYVDSLHRAFFIFYFNKHCSF